MARYVRVVSLHDFEDRPTPARRKKPARRRGVGAHLPAVIEEPLPEEEEDIEGWENEADVDVEEEDVGEDWEDDEAGADDPVHAAALALSAMLQTQGATPPQPLTANRWFFHLPTLHLPRAEKAIRRLKGQSPDVRIRIVPLTLKKARIDLSPKPAPGPLRSRVAQAAQKLRTWSSPVDLGPNMKIRTRSGFRAAVMEIKPGLFVVAEVPQQSVEFGFGPLLLAPALAKTLGRVFQRRGAGQGAPPAQQPGLLTHPVPPALPGPTSEAENHRVRWLEEDLAAELGCSPTRRCV